MLLRPVLFGLVLVLSSIAGPAAVLIQTNSSWNFFRGMSEASAPDAADWRQIGFDDSAWESGLAAFYYENQPGSTNAYTGNTVLADMFGHYTCVFLRHTFLLTNPHDFAALQVAALSDDGFIAWINGVEVARFNMPAGDIPFNGVSSPALAEPVPWYQPAVSSRIFARARDQRIGHPGLQRLGWRKFRFYHSTCVVRDS